LSALHTGRLNPPGNNPSTHFCNRLSRPQGHSATERIMSIKNSSDTIGNRTRDLLVCSAVPQPLRHRALPYVDKPSANLCAFFRIGLCCSDRPYYSETLLIDLENIFHKITWRRSGRFCTPTIRSHCRQSPTTIHAQNYNIVVLKSGCQKSYGHGLSERGLSFRYPLTSR
jgi:hypothetical protein